MPWVGPFQIKEFLKKSLDKKQPLPTGKKGIHLVTKKKWQGTPSKKCEPMYVGGVTGDSDRLLSRVGELVAAMFGLYSKNTKTHTGGQLISTHFRRTEEKEYHPLGLWIAWRTDITCNRCAEKKVYDEIRPWCNERSPPFCNKHG